MKQLIECYLKILELRCKTLKFGNKKSKFKTFQDLAINTLSTGIHLSDNIKPSNNIYICKYMFVKV